MSRLLVASVLVAALAACGGKSSSPAPATPLPPEEETKVEEPKPATEPEPVAKEPAPPPEPTTITIPAEPVTVKLVKPGKGKKAPLAYALTAGSKHAFETAILVESSAGPNTTIMPKMVLGYSAEVLEVGADGAKVRMVLDTIAFQDVPGQTIDVGMIEGALGTLKGLTSEYTIGAQGIPGPQTVTFPAGAEADPSMMQQIVPALVVLPTEKVGNGATWEVAKKGVSNFTAEVKTVYTLKARKGATATVEFKTTIKGEAQKYEEGGFTADVTKLEGSGKGKVEVRTDWPVALGAVDQDVSIGLSFQGQAMETRSKTAMTTTAK